MASRTAMLVEATTPRVLLGAGAAVATDGRGGSTALSTRPRFGKVAYMAPEVRKRTVPATAGAGVAVLQTVSGPGCASRLPARALHDHCMRTPARMHLRCRSCALFRTAPHFFDTALAGASSSPPPPPTPQTRASVVFPNTFVADVHREEPEWVRNRLLGAGYHAVDDVHATCVYAQLPPCGTFLPSLLFGSTATAS